MRFGRGSLPPHPRTCVLWSSTSNYTHLEGVDLVARNDAGLRAIAEEAVSPYADPRDVEVFAKHLPEKYLLCRELRHNWLPFGTPGRYKDGGFQRILRCNRCKTKRVMELDSRGMILSSHYVHPDGYLLEGLGRIVGEGLGILRLASITRAIEKDGTDIPLIAHKDAGKTPPAKPVKKAVAKKAPAKKAATSKRRKV